MIPILSVFLSLIVFAPDTLAQTRNASRRATRTETLGNFRFSEKVNKVARFEKAAEKRHKKYEEAAEKKMKECLRVQRRRVTTAQLSQYKSDMLQCSRELSRAITQAKAFHTSYARVYEETWKLKLEELLAPTQGQTVNQAYVETARSLIRSMDSERKFASENFQFRNQHVRKMLECSQVSTTRNANSTQEDRTLPGIYDRVDWENNRHGTCTRF